MPLLLDYRHHTSVNSSWTRCGVTASLKVPLIKLFQHTHPPF